MTQMPAVTKNWQRNCYTSVQNTCTRLVQITSCDINKYALLTSQQ